MDSWKLQLWRRLSPGKNPPLMLEHLGFHPTPPSLPLPPSLVSIYPLTKRWCCFGLGEFLSEHPEPRLAGKAQRVCVCEQKEQKTGAASSISIPCSPAVPTHQTPLTHGIDPRGEHTCPCKTRTNKPPSTVCSVSHPHLPFNIYNTFTVRPSPHTPRRPSALVPRGDSRDFTGWDGMGWGGLKGDGVGGFRDGSGEHPLSGSYLEKSALRREKGCARRIGWCYFYPCL